MPETAPRFTTVADAAAEGRRLLARASNGNEYEWQWEVGSWFIVLDDLIETTMTDDFRTAYRIEKIGTCRLKADDRLRLIVEWLELARRSARPAI